MKVKDLLKASLQHDKDEIETDMGLGNLDDRDMEMISQDPRKKADLSAELNKIMAGIDQKMMGMSSCYDMVFA